MARFATRATAFAFTLAFAGATGVVQSASAQDDGQSGDQEMQQQDVKTDWSEQKLQQFATAATDVKEVFDEYRPKIKNAESSDQANAMQKEASDKAAKAVKDSGLSVEEYNQINQAIQADEKLYDRVMSIIRDRQNGGGDSGGGSN